MLPEAENRNDQNVPATGALHSWVYTALIGLALWMVLWAWSFVGSGEVDYILFIVSGFICTVVGLQLVLMRVRRADKTMARMPLKIARRRFANGRAAYLWRSVAVCALAKPRC